MENATRQLTSFVILKSTSICINMFRVFRCFSASPPVICHYSIYVYIPTRPCSNESGFNGFLRCHFEQNFCFSTSFLANCLYTGSDGRPACFAPESTGVGGAVQRFGLDVPALVANGSALSIYRLRKL